MRETPAGSPLLLCDDDDDVVDDDDERGDSVGTLYASFYKNNNTQAINTVFIFNFKRILVIIIVFGSLYGITILLIMFLNGL